MIKKIVLLLSIAGLIFITSCSKSDNIAGNDGGGNNATDTTNYYPNKNGNYYKYSIESTDSNGTKSTGTRSATFNGTIMILGTEYQVQVDSTTLANVSTTMLPNDKVAAIHAARAELAQCFCIIAPRSGSNLPY